ncbi:MAG: hypothetical protein ABI885_27310 [Gammaproteobacteria bacterium]
MDNTALLTVIIVVIVLTGGGIYLESALGLSPGPHAFDVWRIGKDTAVPPSLMPRKPLPRIAWALPRNTASVASGILAVVVLLLVTLKLSGVRITENTPRNATVIVDDVRRVYTSPPCMEHPAIRSRGEFRSRARTVTIAEARRLRYSQDSWCSRLPQGFGGNTWSIPHYAMIRAGLLSQGSRWNPDGSWRW